MDTLTKHTLKHNLTFLLLISQIFHSQIFIFCKFLVKSNYKQQPLQEMMLNQNNKEKTKLFLIDYAQWGDYLQTLAMKPNSHVQMEIVST